VHRGSAALLLTLQIHAAVVVWSADASKSEWVRAEADAARTHRKLIQTALTEMIPPLPFNQIQCANLGDWNGEEDHPGRRKVRTSLVANCRNCKFTPVGKKDLAKNFGAIELYRLERASACLLRSRLAAIRSSCSGVASDW
jgi:hypothetical protein